jgi:hypothetical protein
LFPDVIADIAQTAIATVGDGASITDIAQAFATIVGA